MLLALASLALAAPSFTISGALGAAAGPPSWGGYGAIDGVAHLGPLGAELRLREGLHTADARTVGALMAGGRYTRGVGYLRGGFLHHHETPLDAFLAQPLRAALGSADGIRHRTGVEIGGGIDVSVNPEVLDDRIGFVLDLGVGIVPDPQGPQVYVSLEQGWSLDFRARRRDAD